MPFTIAGFGKEICSAAGDVYWGAEADRDAVECITAFYIPLLPIRAVHVFDHNVKAGLVTLLTGIFTQEQKYVPIEYRRSLFFRALFRRVSVPLLVLGVVLTLMGYLGERMSDAWKTALSAAGVGLLLVLAVCAWLYWSSDSRNKNLRYVLGRHGRGTSDPATWTEHAFANIASPRELFGTKSYGGAVNRLLEDGRYSDAMWAARLCAALESRVKGEQLTDDILADTDVADALRELKSQAAGKSFQLTPAVSVDTLKLWRKRMAGRKATTPDDE